MARSYKTFSMVLAVAVLLISVPPLVLAYPDFLFDRKTVHGNFIILSTQPSPLENGSVLDSVADHLRATGFYNVRTPIKVVLCSEGSVMKLLEVLSFTSAQSGFHHFSGTIYLFPDRIEAFRNENQQATGEEEKLLKYTYQEFKLKDILIHEAMHKLHSDTLGMWNYKRKMPPPHWKAEGFAEYYTFLRARQQDPTYDFKERIRLYTSYQEKFPLMYLKSQLLYEYLTEYEHMPFANIMEEETDEEESFREMMKWYRMADDIRNDNKP